MNSERIENAVQLVKAGSNEGLEFVYAYFKKPLFQFVYRYTQDTEFSLDIVQDTFIKFHQYAKTYDENKSSLKTYIFRIAYQLMINRLKRQARMKTLLPFLYEKHEEKISHDEKLTVQDAIKQLPEEQRAVVLLAYYHDLPQKDIADVLQIPIGTVKSRLHTAIKRLRDLLEVEKDG